MAGEHEPDRESQTKAEGVGPWTGHADIDRRMLEMTWFIVKKIDRDPALVRTELANIARWTRQKGGYLPRCNAEWKELIETHLWERLREILLEESDEGQRLRSSHPFTGVLTQDERDAIYARHGIDIPRMRRECEERTGRPSMPLEDQRIRADTVPASCITFLSEQAFAPQNRRFWSRRRVWFQFTVGEDKPPMLSVDNRGKGVLSMDCSAKRSPL